ncbi:sodium:solute symporter family transporter [Candidatus Jidaibacter acanthamoebae]|nr:ATP-binding protein [Candidatus Jidaibacter acanthamoeba]
MEYLARYFDIDKAIILIFLVFTLIIGIIAGRKTKDTNDYAIANKSYGSPILFLTLTVSLIGGGSTIGEAAQFYNDGLVYLIASIGTPVSILLTALYITPKFDRRFNGRISVADMIEYFYGYTPSRFAGVIGYFVCLGILSIQCTVMGYLTFIFLEISYSASVCLSVGLLILYSTFGGIRAITITNIFQFAMLIVMVPLIASISVTEAGGLNSIFSNFKTNSHMQILNHPKFFDYLALFLFWSLPFSAFFPPQIQRYLMVRNHKQATRITFLYLFLKIAVIFIVLSIAFSAVKLFPDVEPKAIIPKIIDDLMPPIIRGIAIAGMLSVTMSTADSALNTAGILITHNTLPANWFYTDKIKLSFLRIFTFITGIIAMFIALQNSNIISVLVLSEILSFSALGIPLLLGMLDLKVSNKSFWACNVFAGCAYFISYYYNIREFAIPIITCMSGISGFMLAHLIENRKIVFIERRYIQRKSGKLVLINTIKNFYTLLPNFKTASSYLKTNLDKFSTNYLMFGIFCCINYTVPYFMWTYQKPENYLLMLLMRLIAGILCTGLLVKDYWPEKIKKYFSIYWYITVLYCLPFMTTIMFMLMEAHIEWLINLTLAIMLLTMLVDWISFIVILITGTILGYLFYRIAIGVPDIPTDFDTIYLLIYVCVFSSLIGLLFVRKKEVVNEGKLEAMRLFGTSIAHEVKDPLSSLNMCIQHIEMILKKLADSSKLEQLEIDNYHSQLVELIEILKNTSIQGIKIIDSLLTSLKSSVIADDRGEYLISECIKQSITEYHQGNLNPNHIQILLSKNIKFYGSMQYMKHLFFNLFRYAYKHNTRSLNIDIRTEGNILYFKDNGRGILKEDLPFIFDRFYSDSKSGNGIGLAFCKIVMEDIGGSIKCNSEVGKFTEFALHFPIINKKL